MSIDTNIPLLLSVFFIIGGLFALTWSADAFIDAASKIARKFGVSPLIVGMIIIGFGTSAPELAVSVLSGIAGHSNLSLGNAYGSSIFNIAAILGVAALINPIKVKPSISFAAVPVLAAITLLSWILVRDGAFQRSNGIILLAVFSVIMPVYCLYDQKTSADCNCENGKNGCDCDKKPQAFVWLMLIVGLTVLVASSHILVWGCVDFARDVLKVSDLMIGLTVVAIGTSLPELASAVVSARKGEHEFVIGNIVGSNLFNTLAVVGIAGTISPFSDFSRYIAVRDLPTMMALTLSIAFFGINLRNFNRPGEISRGKGLLWLIAFAVYLIVMIMHETA
jgi:cation:H+ antiporter